MSNSIIPHLLSDSPPPIAGNVDEDYEDEFGDYTGPGDLSFDDNISTPSTPKNSKLFYSDNYPVFELNGIDHNYDMKENFEDKSTQNDITKELPSKKYINILDHLEMNIPKLENNEKELENLESALSTREKEEINILGENIGNISINNDNSLIVSVHDEQKIEGRDEEEQYLKNQNFVDSKPEQIFTHKLVSEEIKNEPNIETKIPELSPTVTQQKQNDLEDLKDDGQVAITLETKVNNVLKAQLKETIFEVHIIDSLELDNDGSQEIELKGQCESVNDIIPKTGNNSSVTPINYNNLVLNKKNQNSKDHNDNSLEYSEVHAGFNKLPHSLEEEIVQGEGSQMNSTIISTSVVNNDNVKSLCEFEEGSGEVLQSPRNKYNLEDEFPLDEASKSDDDFGEFTDFQNCLETNISDKPTTDNLNTETRECAKVSLTLEKISSRNNETEHQQKDELDDEFDDFANFSSFSQKDDDGSDEFSEYSAFSKKEPLKDGEQTPDKLIKICETPEEALKQSEIVLKTTFISSKSTLEDFMSYDFTANNLIFDSLKDITETNALTYQWGKSSAQGNLLKTLNIDKRNILYGPGWNAGVPIFAANLCSTPLEPIKSEIPVPLTPQKVATQETITSVEVCTEFGWNSSFVPHSLDSSELAEKQMEAIDPAKLGNIDDYNLEIGPSKSVEPLSILSDDFDTSKEKVSMIDLKFLESQTENVIGDQDNNESEDEFSEFASYQPKYEKQIDWPKKMLPLRESHISYQNVDTTPSLPIQKLSIDFNNEIISSMDLSILESKNEVTQSHQQTSDLNIDYTEFQSSFIEDKTLDSETHKNEYSTIQLNPQNHQIDSISSESVSTGAISESSNQIDDEFSDFCSSLPNQSKVQPENSYMFSKPLEPAVLQPVPVNKAPVIEWPDPGVNEEEINRIVSGCLLNNKESEKKVENQSEKPFKKKTETKKKILTIEDDEEWSDFVSVKDQVKSRTATPDLPLSVFNLGSIQPIKAPTPLVTPNGIVCSPVKKTQDVVNMNLGLFQSRYQTQNQHFKTSQAFHSLYQNPKTLHNTYINTGTTSTSSCNNCSEEPSKNLGRNDLISGRNLDYIRPQNSTLSSANSKTVSPCVNSVDDDEWSDFVSASNSSLATSNPSLLQSATNIITNPGHSMAFFNKNAPNQYSINSMCTVVRQERRNIPTISALPDLEFVSPRARSMKK